MKIGVVKKSKLNQETCLIHQKNNIWRRSFKDAWANQNRFSTSLTHSTYTKKQMLTKPHYSHSMVRGGARLMGTMWNSRDSRMSPIQELQEVLTRHRRIIFRTTSNPNHYFDQSILCHIVCGRDSLWRNLAIINDLWAGFGRWKALC